MGSINPSPINLETDFLIVGAGPAGASLACFLASHSLTGILLSSAAGTAFTPRAHLTNPPALEALRDCDPFIYDECVRLGTAGDAIKHYRFCETMAGEEYARNIAWGQGARKGEYEAVSPCRYMDLSQNLLEPVLVKWASGRGWKVRFDTTLLTFVDESDAEEGGEQHNNPGGLEGERRILATVMDNLTGVQYQIRTRYLFGADGGRSTVASILDLPFTSIPGGGYATNVLLRADLTHLMQHRQGNLHVVLRLEKNYPFVCVARMVKPWTEWMFVFLPKGPTAPIPKRSFSEWEDIARDIVGENVAVKVIDVSGWAINETSADVISKGNTFCLGDAIHRHPPTLGLGSNTCIQDAFNLAWKISFVHRNLAAPSLLSTYNTERQPIAAALVTESNFILRLDLQLWGSMGLQPYTPCTTTNTTHETTQALLQSASAEGKHRRKQLSTHIRSLHRELHALGTAMGHLYPPSSPAIYTHDEPAPFTPSPAECANPHQNYTPCTYPGRRLPHVLLGPGSRVPGPLTSTLDIAGKGAFCLFTGIGGEGWVRAGALVRERFGVAITVATVGRGCMWADTYLEWEEKSGVEEDGCVLVRPDYFVAWRARESAGGGVGEVERLGRVMSAILGVDGVGGC